MHCKDRAYVTKAGNLFSEPIIFHAAEEALHVPRSMLGCYDKTLLTLGDNEWEFKP